MQVPAEAIQKLILILWTLIQREGGREGQVNGGRDR